MIGHAHQANNIYNREYTDNGLTNCTFIYNSRNARAMLRVLTCSHVIIRLFLICWLRFTICWYVIPNSPPITSIVVEDICGLFHGNTKNHRLTFTPSIHSISPILFIIQPVAASSSIGTTRILPHPRRRLGVVHLAVLAVAQASLRPPRA